MPAKCMPFALSVCGSEKMSCPVSANSPYFGHLGSNCLISEKTGTSSLPTTGQKLPSGRAVIRHYRAKEETPPGAGYEQEFLSLAEPGGLGAKDVEALTFELAQEIPVN